MSENESRPLERWSMAQRQWSGRTSDFVNAHTTGVEIDALRAKADALDKILAAWGMTWDEYQNGKAHKQELHKQRGEISQDG